MAMENGKFSGWTQHFEQWMFVRGLVLCGFLIGLAYLTGCSLAPLTRGSNQYYGSVKDAHQEVRFAQEDQFRRKGIDTQTSLDALNTALEAEDCYRLTHSYVQWGVYQPDVVFMGDSISKGLDRAYIYVTPTFEEKEPYYGPTQTKGFRIYRIESDAPFSASLIRQLEGLVARDDVCVRLATTPLSSSWSSNGGDRGHHVVTGASIQHMSKVPQPVVKEKPVVSSEAPRVEPPKTEEPAKAQSPAETPKADESKTEQKSET